MDPALVLPVEIMEEIFLYLSTAEVVRCAFVSKLWQSIAYSNRLWKLKYIEDSFPPVNNVVVTRLSSVSPPRGSWVKEYRYHANPTVPPSEFIRFNKSISLSTKDDFSISGLDTDGKVLAVQYAYMFVELYDLFHTQCKQKEELLNPLQRIEHAVVPHLDNRIFIYNKDLILFEKGKIHFYKKSDCFRLVKTCVIGSWLMEVVTKDYIYLIYTHAINVWSVKDRIMIKTQQFDPDLKLLKGSESVCVADQMTVTIWEGLKETVIDIGMEAHCYGSNEYLRAFYCDDYDDYYWILVYRPNGDLVFKEVVTTGVTQVDPLLNWGVRFLYWNMKTWCWKAVTFDGEAFMLDSAFLDAPPFPLNHKYILYQFDLTLCLFDVTQSKIVSKFQMGSHYHYFCTNGVIVLRNSLNADIFFFHDRYLS